MGRAPADVFRAFVEGEEQRRRSEEGAGGGGAAGGPLPRDAIDLRILDSSGFVGQARLAMHCRTRTTQTPTATPTTPCPAMHCRAAAVETSEIMWGFIFEAYARAKITNVTRPVTLGIHFTRNSAGNVIV